MAKPAGIVEKVPLRVASETSGDRYLVVSALLLVDCSGLPFALTVPRVRWESTVSRGLVLVGCRRTHPLCRPRLAPLARHSNHRRIFCSDNLVEGDIPNDPLGLSAKEVGDQRVRGQEWRSQRSRADQVVSGTGGSRWLIGEALMIDVVV